MVRPGRRSAAPKGTTFIVRDLFFNTPARQKFLKRDSAEGSAVFAVVQHAALSHPEVSFPVPAGGQGGNSTPRGRQPPERRLRGAGAGDRLGLLPCKGSGEDLSPLRALSPGPFAAGAPGEASSSSSTAAM